jgi:hypothetical protein
MTTDIDKIVSMPIIVVNERYLHTRVIRATEGKAPKRSKDLLKKWTTPVSILITRDGDPTELGISRDAGVNC